MEPDDFVLRPLPNSYFTRDPSAWIYGGVVVNPMYWPARRLEALNVEAIYRFHPDFRDAGFEFWYSREQEGESFGRVSSEGGDIMPIGNRTVAIGMSERTTGQMIEKIALALFEKGAADRVIAAGMTRDRAHMHLDTVFTFLDRDCVTMFPKVVDSITAYSVRPGDKEGELDVAQGRLVPRRDQGRARAQGAARHRDRRRRVAGRARAVGRRQQRRRAGARRRRRLRAQRVHQHADAQGRHRGPRPSTARRSARAAAAATA